MKKYFFSQIKLVNSKTITDVKKLFYYVKNFKEEDFNLYQVIDRDNPNGECQVVAGRFLDGKIQYISLDTSDTVAEIAKPFIREIQATSKITDIRTPSQVKSKLDQITIIWKDEKDYSPDKNPYLTYIRDVGISDGENNFQGIYCAHEGIDKIFTFFEHKAKKNGMNLAREFENFESSRFDKIINWLRGARDIILVKVLRR